MTKVQNTFKSSLIFPLLCKYAQQTNNQPAYIYMDCRDGSVWADYSSEIGWGCSIDEWNGKILSFRVNEYLTANMVSELIDDNLDKFQKIVDCWDEVYKLSNYVGTLTKEGQDVCEQLQRALSDEINDVIVYESYSEYTNGETQFLDADQSIDEYVKNIIDEQTVADYYLTDFLSNPENLKDEALDSWADALYDDEEIPKHVAKILLNDGRCNDSQWIEELKELAHDA